MEDRLREIIISITNRCNLRCAMCHIPEASYQHEMSTEMIKDLISDSLLLYPSSIVFSGGEPLLRQDIFELVSFANQRKINTCLTSNGTLLDDLAAKKLSSSGIGVVNISIDGTEDIHDSLRGKGNFKKAVKALEVLSCHNIETTIATMVCRHNYKTLPYIMDLGLRYGATTVKFQPFNDIFLIRKDIKREFLAFKEEEADILENIKNVITMSEKYKISINPHDYLLTVPKYLSGRAENDSGKACPALWSTCPISAHGDVYPCWVLSGAAIGNVERSRLSEIWNSKKHNNMRRSIVNRGCKGCLMSCYDYNLDNNSGTGIISKFKLFKKPRNYRKMYFSIYQKAIYIAMKIWSRSLDIVRSKAKGRGCKKHILNEILQAKGILKERLLRLKSERI